MITDLDKEKYWGLFKLDGKAHLDELRAHRGDAYIQANYGSLDNEISQLDSMLRITDVIRIEESPEFIVLFTEQDRAAIFSKQYRTITSRGIFHRIHGGTYQPRTMSYKYCTVRRFIASTQEVYKRDIANRFLSKVAEHAPDATRWYRKITVDDTMIFNIFSSLARGATASEVKVMDKLIQDYRLIFSKPMLAYYACSLVKHGLDAIDIVEVVTAKGFTPEMVKVVSKSNLIQHSTICHDLNIEIGKATQFIEVLPQFKVLKKLTAPSAPTQSVGVFSGLVGSSQTNNIITDINSMEDLNNGTVFEPYLIDHKVKPQHSDYYDLYVLNGCLASVKLSIPGVEYLKVACGINKSNTDKVSISLILRAMAHHVELHKHTVRSGSDLVDMMDELKKLFNVPTYYKLIKYMRSSGNSHSLKMKADLYSLLNKYLKPSNKLYKPIIDYSNKAEEHTW